MRIAHGMYQGSSAPSRSERASGPCPSARHTRSDSRGNFERSRSCALSRSRRNTRTTAREPVVAYTSSLASASHNASLVVSRAHTAPRPEALVIRAEIRRVQIPEVDAVRERLLRLPRILDPLGRRRQGILGCHLDGGQSRSRGGAAWSNRPNAVCYYLKIRHGQQRRE